MRRAKQFSIGGHNNMFRIEKLSIDDIASDLLMHFHHHQIINKKYVRQNNQWEVIECNELRQWSKEKRIWITEYLHQQIHRGGSVIAAYDTDVLVAFCSVDGYLCGKTSRYANLTMLFIDDEYKRKGIGKTLFREIGKYASKSGADRLFISAIPSIETVEFYLNMGCIEASEIIVDYIDTENDRYLEYRLL